MDGYNIINSWSDIFNLNRYSLEECRDKLLNIMSNYQGFKKIEVIIVFDAHLVKGSQQKQETFDNLKVVFTKENETADNYIERFVYKFSDGNVIRVATSDYLEQTLVLSNGGVRMSPRELRLEVDSAVKVTKSVAPQAAKTTNSIMSHMKPEMFEKLDKIRKGKF